MDYYSTYEKELKTQVFRIFFDTLYWTLIAQLFQNGRGYLGTG